MGITFSWYDPAMSILHIRFVGLWTWRDCETAVTQCRQHSESVVHRVDVLIDLQQSAGFPPQAFAHAAPIARRKRDNTHYLIVVSDQPYIKSLFSIYSRTLPEVAQHYRLYETLAAAVAFIETDRLNSPYADTRPRRPPQPFPPNSLLT